MKRFAGQQTALEQYSNLYGGTNEGNESSGTLRAKGADFMAQCGPVDSELAEVW